MADSDAEPNRVPKLNLVTARSARMTLFSSGRRVKAMYQFAIDMGEENGYSQAALQGVFVAGRSLKTRKSEVGSGSSVLTTGFGKWVIW